MGTAAARIYCTIYLFIYGPVRETANLGFGCNPCLFVFPFTILLNTSSLKLAIPTSLLALYFLFQTLL